MIARIACNETRIRRLGNFVCAIPKTICQIRLLRVSGIHSIAGWSLLFSMFGSRVALVLALAGCGAGAGAARVVPTAACAGPSALASRITQQPTSTGRAHHFDFTFAP